MTRRAPAELDRILRIAELREVTGLSAASIYRQIQRGEFPAPYELGPNCRGWKLSEVLVWQSRLKQVALTPSVDQKEGDVRLRQGRATDGER